MKAVSKVFVGIALSFMIVFTCIGYAAHTTTLSVTGDTLSNPPVDVLIKKVELDTSNSANYNTQSADFYHPRTLVTTLNMPRNAYVTYKVTLYNNTPYRYAYSSLEYDNTDGYNNSYIGNYITLSAKDANRGTLNGNDIIEPYSEMVVYITYTKTSWWYNNTDIKNIINIKFGVNIDSVETVAVDKAFAKFKEILNDTSDGGGYQTLIDKIDDKYTGRADQAWTSNYIGNVVDSSSADTNTINTLFGEDLKITIDGTETNVTVIIKRENLDNNEKTGDNFTATANGGSYTANGCEMTLYMTTSPLTKGSQPTIYVAVFTCNQDENGNPGAWFMIGDTYVGTSRIVGYEGQETEGSFVTDDWYATSNQTFKVTDSYSYTIYANQSIQDITQVAADTNLKNIFYNLVVQADTIIEKSGSAGSAVEQLIKAFDTSSRCFKKSDDGAITVNSGVLRAELIPLIKELEVALRAFE